MDFDLKAYFKEIFHNKSEFDLCILVREDDWNLANQIKLIIKGKNLSNENEIEVYCDHAGKKVIKIFRQRFVINKFLFSNIPEDPAYSTPDVSNLFCFWALRPGYYVQQCIFSTFFFGCLL